MKDIAQLKVFFIMPVIFLLVSCGSGTNKSINNNDELREAINSQTFEIQNQWALPMTGGMIELIGNPNFIRFDKDSVNIFLPYYGVRHSGGGYPHTEGGVVYEGEAIDLSITEERNGKFLIEFEGRQDQDQIRFLINIYPDGSAHTSVIPTHRQTISYRGNVRELPEDL